MMPSDTSHIPDICQTAAHIDVVLRPLNKFTLPEQID
jgi:hypothetical protein